MPALRSARDGCLFYRHPGRILADGPPAAEPPLPTVREVPFPPMPSDSSPSPSAEADAETERAGAGRAYVSRTFRSLDNRNFRYLWFGMLFMMAGTNVQMVARSQLAWELSDSAFMVGLVGIGFAPPILLLSMFGGAVADRMERKRVIQTGQLGMAVVSLVVAVSIVTGTVTVYHLIAASLCRGTFWAFLMPARQALIPQLVGTGRVSNAMALNASGMALTGTAAPAIAGFVYAWLGAQGAYFAIVGLNVGAFLLTTQLPRLPIATRDTRRPMLADIGEGLRYVGGNRTVLVLLMLALSTAVLAMPFRNLLSVYNGQALGRGPESLGMLLGMLGAGALVGSLGLAGMRRGQPRGVALLATTVLSGLMLLAAARTGIYGVALLVMFMMGIGDSGRRALSAAMIMEQTDREHQGRVMGIYQVNFGLIPLGVLPLSAIAEAQGIRTAVLIAGVLLTVVSLGFITLTHRVRRL